MVTFPKAPSPITFSKQICSLGNSQQISSGSSYSVIFVKVVFCDPNLDRLDSRLGPALLVLTDGRLLTMWISGAETSSVFSFCLRSMITFFVHWVTAWAFATANFLSLCSLCHLLANHMMNTIRGINTEADTIAMTFKKQWYKYLDLSDRKKNDTHSS